MQRIQRRKTFRARWLVQAAAGVLACSLASVPTPAVAQTATANIDIPAQPLADALMQLSRQANVNIVADSSLTRKRRAPAVKGAMSVEAALDRLLAPSGLSYRANGGSFIVERREVGNGRDGADIASSNGSDDDAPPGDDRNAEIIVTGSRIRGAPPASPVVILTSRDIRNAGQTDLGQVMRSLPQNFSGGQNPGVAPGQTLSGVANNNATSGAAANLRGLGPDATLTLLNGRRLSYEGSAQGIDLSAIPIGAIDRVEVVADGASALYGSDDVAGVVNVILKQDFSGLETSARFGGATAGGDTQIEFGAVGGATWNTGGFVLTYDYGHDTGIDSGQRNFTSYMPKPNSLYPALRHNSVLVSGHQSIIDSLYVTLDGLYNNRTSRASFNQGGTVFRATLRDESFTISPTIRGTLPSDWSASLNGTLSRDRSRVDQPTFDVAGTKIRDSISITVNRGISAELNLEGPIFRLPAGDVRLSLGGGYRRNTYHQQSLTGTSNIRGNNESAYGFGEVYVPLIAADQDVPLIRTLSFTAAGRYEKYNRFGSVATPKLGVIFAPTKSLELKGSWGKSFKVPTLLQQYQATSAALRPAATLGGSGLPPTATVLSFVGGNRNLRPERATSWSTTAAFRPSGLPGLTVEVSYFDVHYTDRVIQPVTALSAALSNPVYREFLIINPSSSQQQTLLATASPFNNYSNAPYDPAEVAALVDDRYTNIAAQKIHGVDFYGRYHFSLLGGTASISDRSSWLRGRQITSSLAQPFAMAGTIFYPAKFRSRGGVGWNGERTFLGAYVNYTDGEIDTRTSPNPHIGSMTTIDLNARYSFKSGRGLLDGLAISASVTNLFDQRPPYIRNTASYFVNYDSLNYSPIGRVLNLTLTKKW